MQRKRTFPNLNIPITDPRFKYIPAASTDIRKTFARVRKEMRRQGEKK